MGYIKIEGIKSSYALNDLGKDIYEYVIKKNPKKVIEFGCLEGYSIIAIATALRDLNNGGELIAYDIWEDYKYKHGRRDVVLLNLQSRGLEDLVSLRYKDFNDFIEAPSHFDLLHLDISNDGNIIKLAYESLKPMLATGATILFEGGSSMRDEVAWMKKYNKPRIQECGVDYKLLTSDFPSIGIIND